MKDIRKKINLRTFFIGGLFTLSFFALIFRTFWIQYIDSPELLVKAKDTWERSSALNPKRGEIVDRNGQVLAYQGKAYTVIARLKPYPNDKKNTNYVSNPEETASKLAPILDMPKEKILQRLMRKDVDQVEIRPGGWKVPKETADKVKELNLPGIGLYEESRRYYPYGTFASHVIGYTNLDGEAKMGLERQMDEQLRGEKGSLKFRKDRLGNQLPGGVESYKPAKDGNKVVLTLDHQIQSYVEDALNQADAKYKMKSVSVVVADPNTGQILAMGSRPSFNPNAPKDIQNFTNPVVSAEFEPGSTFKIVTLAAAIEEKEFNANEYYKSGTYKIKGSPPVRDHNRGIGWGWITFKEGVKRSSNVAFVILGYDRLKKDRLFSYLQKFGFGGKTGIELPHEARGSFDPNRKYYPRDIASITFGQGVTVTAIQQVAAVGAIANGGKLMKPYIVKEIRDPKTNEVIQEFKPQMVRRVVSEDTAKQVRDLLDAVVNEKHGTGQPFALPGYHVAGKTGTAQVARNGHYVRGKYINSFIGFAPKDKPRLLVYVMVEEPQIDTPSAGGKIIAAPIFKSVMERSLQYLKLSPDETDGHTTEIMGDESTVMPDLIGKNVSQAKQILGQAGLRAEILGNGKTIVRQYPSAKAELTKGSAVYILTVKDGTQMPNLTGKTLREVMELASLLDIQVTGINGEGYVITQSIQPGAKVKKGDKLAVTLAPKSTTGAAQPEGEKAKKHKEESGEQNIKTAN
ncbi:penicillin-binding transpeptidase domain-containing protein [Aneurinibacillus thermoaerophilus]|uniref:PASTA domain-containing penicillin-binding protein n=1 Tax=Aneurinibacillus TaxID=55079 RepID=UPI0009EA25CD|nr:MULTISPECIES: PASTA domain-containing penicillin-binding protein [Aneurinibacillus]MED0756681.1 penicillin-binding transpeptidase domain-containing protein [Aneurinibacillus thermoaerophilus]MED0760731.1 penicillin-binding transpeptidase domain-containing protein [Aneurinibacillus thermoaerophilus]